MAQTPFITRWHSHVAVFKGQQCSKVTHNLSKLAIKHCNCHSDHAILNKLPLITITRILSVRPVALPQGSRSHLELKGGFITACPCCYFVIIQFNFWNNLPQINNIWRLKIKCFTCLIYSKVKVTLVDQKSNLAMSCMCLAYAGNPCRMDTFYSFQCIPSTT